MRLSILILTLLVSGCATAPRSATCDATLQARAFHAAALAETTDDRVAVTGANLVELIDATCKDI
jgi:hypothetical protein